MTRAAAVCQRLKNPSICNATHAGSALARKLNGRKIISLPLSSSSKCSISSLSIDPVILTALSGGCGIVAGNGLAKMRQITPDREDMKTGLRGIGQFTFGTISLTALLIGSMLDQ